VRSYSHNAICILLLICSKSQPSDDSIGSKNVAVPILYKVVFDDYLSAPYFTVQHNRIHNFKIEILYIMTIIIY